MRAMISLIAPRLARALGDHLHAPAVALGVARVHAEEVAGEERALVAAGAGADLEEQVLLVVGIARQQHALHLVLERGRAATPGAHLLLGELAHRRVARHVGGRGDVLAGLAPRAVRLDHGLDLRAFLGEPAVAVEVVDHAGIGEPRVDLLQARLEARELGRDRILHGFGSPFASISGKRARTARARPSRSPSAACDRACIG